MADETKKKPAAKKEAKPETSGDKPAAAEKQAAKPAGDGQPVKGSKKGAPAAEAGAAAAEPAAAPAEGAPAAAVAAPTAAELLADDLAGKKIVKAKGSKNITTGIANILATFNNTQVS